MTPRKRQVAPRHRGRSGDLRRTVRLFRRFAGSRKVYVVGMVLLVFEAATAVVEPYPIAYLIDFLQGAKPSLRSQLGVPALIPSERYETILLLTLALVLMAAVNSAADSLTEVCMARGGRSLGYNIRVAMYAHLQRLPLAYHDKRRTGDVLTRVTGDVLVAEEFVVKSVSNIVGSLLVLVGSFTFLAFQSWNVALVALVVVPMLAAVSSHFSRRIKKASKTQRDREGDLASTTQEMLTSIRLVQSYGRGSVDLRRFSSQTQKSMLAALGAANIQAQFSFVIALVEALSISAVVWLGVWLVDRDAITVGTLVLFVLLLQNMFKPARKIVSEWYKIGKVFASVERIDDLLDREVVVSDLPDAVPAPPLQGRLTFRHVTFAYPVEHESGARAARREPVLSDVDFEIAPGEVVALSGDSGAGKSTIAQLVPRLYDPDEGEVLVDGHPLPRLTLASLRSQISLVLQDTVLLSGSVAENIGYGVDDPTAEEIEAAARMANAHDFIMELPHGYATQLGERGCTLSGGQRQRISIARAFIRRAPILILDEPTTGLDHESARSVVGALRSLIRGTTTIVISHDPSLVLSADRVLAVSAGRVVETARHSARRSAGQSARRPAARSARLSTARPANEKPAAREEAAVRATDVAMSRAGGSGGDLADRLRDRLPGLPEALDPEVAADRISRLLVGAGATVEGVSVGKVWLRDDGTCSLRYRLRMSSEAFGSGEESVLGRLHRDGDAAAGYLRRGLRRLVDTGTPVPAAGSWVTPTAVVAEAGLALHRFPIDPDLPTLPRAMDPDVVGALAPLRSAQRRSVSLVHHPRVGACVLRYSPSGPITSPPADLYGKVYGDESGDVVDGFLRELSRRQPQDAARFPQPVLYAPHLRLLVTEALPGGPLVPRLIRSVSATKSHAGAEGDEAALAAAVSQAGRALAVLHASDLATAPVHTSSDELQRRRSELEVVGGVWPEVADRVRRSLDMLAADPPEAPDMALSHGDFTPSQVLIDGGRAPAMVDLDTLCWADPALDLGRFLAHLEMLVAKHGGRAGEALADRLAGEFLAGYGDATARTAAAAAAADRIAFYRATTLARTALHSCRQLKTYRLELAMSLLQEVPVDKVDR